MSDLDDFRAAVASLGQTTDLVQRKPTPGAPAVLTGHELTDAQGKPIPGTDDLLAHKDEASTTQTVDWRRRAESMIGSPYRWGGTTKQGIDCSAFVSQVWGVARQTTDTLQSVAAPVAKTQLQSGDALNLPTWKDPHGYGHVRLFDAWADAGHTQMVVYESSDATGGVVKRVIPYDDAYQPMRLKTSPQAAGRADAVEQQTEATSSTVPSRYDPSTPEGKNLSAIGQIALRAGLGRAGARAAQAVAVTEGALTGKRGDDERSHGWFQFFEGGELPNYAAANGWSIEQAKAVIAANPEHAATWALNGYLGNAIKAGIADGKSGAALATYAQTVGQRSKTPERAGQVYDSIFADAPPLPQGATTPKRPTGSDDGALDDPVRQLTKGPSVKPITPEQRAAMDADVQSQVKSLFSPPQDEQDAMSINSMTGMMQGLGSPIWRKSSSGTNLSRTGFDADPYGSSPYTQSLDPTAHLFDVAPTARRRSSVFQPFTG